MKLARVDLRIRYSSLTAYDLMLQKRRRTVRYTSRMRRMLVPRDSTSYQYHLGKKRKQAGNAPLMSTLDEVDGPESPYFGKPLDRRTNIGMSLQRVAHTMGRTSETSSGDASRLLT